MLNNGTKSFLIFVNNGTKPYFIYQCTSKFLEQMKKNFAIAKAAKIWNAGQFITSLHQKIYKYFISLKRSSNGAKAPFFDCLEQADQRYQQHLEVTTINVEVQSCAEA